MRNGFSCCSLDGVQKGARRKVCPKHRYHKMECSMENSKSLLTNVVKTFPIDVCHNFCNQCNLLSFGQILRTILITKSADFICAWSPGGIPQESLQFPHLPSNTTPNGAPQINQSPRTPEESVHLWAFNQPPVLH